MSKPHVWPAPRTGERPPARTTRFDHSEDCHWRNCPNVISLTLDVPLCQAHIAVVRAAIERADASAEAKAEASRIDVAARTASGIARVEAGERLTGQDISPGSIYFVQVDDLIKIGYTRSLYDRLRSYPPNAVVLATQPGTMKMEKALHGQFRFALAKGREWFHVRPELTEHIAGVVEIHGEVSPGLQNRYRDASDRKQVIVPKGYRGAKKTAA